MIIERWHQAGQVYLLSHRRDELRGLVEPSEETEAAFAQEQNSLEMAITTQPATLAGVMAFVTMMIEADFGDDPDSLRTSLGTLLGAVEALTRVATAAT